MAQNSGKNEILRELALLFLAKDGPVVDEQGGASARLGRKISLLVKRTDTARAYRVFNKLEDDGLIERKRDPRIHHNRTYRISIASGKEKSDTIRDILQREDEILAKARDF